jgi:hypothetical protein
MNQPVKTDKNFDRPWKIISLFHMLRDTYAKFYNPPEHSVADEVIALFKGRVIFKQYIPKKHKSFHTKIYKLCNMSGYTYDMSIYLGKDRQNATQTMTAIHATVKSLTWRTEGADYKLYVDNVFSSLDLFDDLHTRAINCCGIVRQNCKGMLGDSGNKTLNLKWGDTHARVRGGLTAVIWEGKRDMCIQTTPQVNFCEELGELINVPSLKTTVGTWATWKKGTKWPIYSISQRTWKWTKTLFFHLLDQTILNSYFILTSCSCKIDH